MQAVIGRTTTVFKAQHAYSSHACITRLPDGDWLVAFAQSLERVPYQHPPGDPQYLNFITRSGDRGETWAAPRVAPGYDWHGVEVPGISALSSGEVLLTPCACRPPRVADHTNHGDPAPFGHLYGAELSPDDFGPRRPGSGDNAG